MTFEEIEFALEANGVKEENIETLMTYCRSNGTDYQKIDDMLVQMGYDKVFAEEFFGGDESEDQNDFYDLDDDEEFFSAEKIHHRHNTEE